MTGLDDYMSKWVCIEDRETSKTDQFRVSLFPCPQTGPRPHVSTGTQREEGFDKQLEMCGQNSWPLSQFRGQ